MPEDKYGNEGKSIRMMRKRVVNINDPEFEKIAVCLSLKLRRKILLLLNKKAMTTAQLSEKLNEPITTISTNVKMLEKAGLIIMLETHGRGNSRPMIRKYACVVMDLRDKSETINHPRRRLISIPIGSFCDYQTSAYYGMASRNGLLAENGSGLWVANRSEAELLWMAGHGYVSYKVSNQGLKDKTLSNFCISMEVCSETATYNNNWESDITVWLNGVELCTYRSPGDFGGRRGLNNPPWWKDHMTQFGLLVRISVTNECTCLNNVVVSNVRLEQLKLTENDYFELKIGVKDSAKQQGGFNLFGKGFGDYKQDIEIYYEFC